MVWNGKTTMELRSEFVRLASQPGANKSQLCRQFEITERLLINGFHEQVKVIGDFTAYRSPISLFADHRFH